MKYIDILTMQKKKLDLNHLLAKYQGISSGTNYNSRFQEPTKEMVPIEEEFYQYKTYQQQPIDRQVSRDVRDVEYNNQTAKNFKGNFVMSKSQVEQFLLSIKDELRLQQKEIGLYGGNAIKQLHQNFQKSHQKLKREILDLLDRAFFENEKNIKQELARQSKIEPPEFAAVHRRINSLDEDINRLLASLKGAQYRKAIAEVVTRDFNIEVGELRSNISGAKINYIQSLGEVQPDRVRIDNIKQNLSKLFYFNKKNPPVSVRPPPEEVSSGIFSIFKDRTQVQPEQPPVQSQSRTRKNFFNFGGD